MARECPPPVRTKGFALNRLAANLGVTIGPVLGGYLAMWNYRALFWVDGLTSLAALALFSRLFQERASGPAAGRGSAAARRCQASGATCGLSFSWFSGSA